MKKKLEILLEILMEKKYSPAIISQAIMLPMAAKNPEMFINKVIAIAQKTATEEQFFHQMGTLTIEM